MEKNIFNDYMEGYINIHNELVDLDVSDKSTEIERLNKIIEANDMLVQNSMNVEDIDSNDKEKHKEFEIKTKQYMENIHNAEKEIQDIQKKQEENQKRKELLENGKNGIRAQAKQYKEEIIAEEQKKREDSILVKRYDYYLKQEHDIEQKLEKFKDIDLETTKEEVERTQLESELRNIRNEIKSVSQQLNQETDMKKKIEKDYILFLGQLNLIDKTSEKVPTVKEREEQNPNLGSTERDGEGRNPNPGSTERDGEGRNPNPGTTERDREGRNPNPGSTERDGEGQNLSTRNNRNLPVRSFWEIYNDTCTEHVGSIAHNINKLAHMKILPAKQEDTVHKILSGFLVLVKAPTKLVAKLPNAIMGTDRKIKEMQENIDNLPLEEFQVLVQSPEKVNSMFNAHVKDTFDRDYLDSQFMKQYKVNGAYLDTVRSRLGREQGAAINYYNRQANVAHTRMQELEEVGKQNWTPEQTNEYNQMVEIYQQCVDEGKKCQGELDTFDEGAKKKSSSYRNISGWFLAKFNPDNREENAQMAGLSKARREIAREGNRTEVNAITGQMQQFARDNTELKGGEKNYIDRGQYSIESPVETLDRGPQTKGRLLLTNIAIVSSVAGLFNQIADNRINREAVEEHNQHLQGVNQQNQNIQVNGQAKVADSPTAPQAEEAITRQTVEAGWNRAERGDLDGTNWNFGSEYHARDIQSHADAAQTAATAESYLQQGNNIEALKTATDYYTKVQNSNRLDTINYMPTHTQHNYSAFTFGDSADMSKVYDFFANGVVPYSTNVNGVIAEMMPALKGGLDLNGVIFAAANALYQGQREGIKDLRKQVKATPRRQEEPEQEEQEQENQQNNHEQENQQNNNEQEQENQQNNNENEELR